MRIAFIADRWENFLRNINEFRNVEDQNNTIIFAVDNGDGTADVRVMDNLVRVGVFITIFGQGIFSGTWRVLDNTGGVAGLGGTMTINFSGEDPPDPDEPQVLP